MASEASVAEALVVAVATVPVPVDPTIDNIYYVTGIRNSNSTNETMRVSIVKRQKLITTINWQKK